MESYNNEISLFLNAVPYNKHVKGEGNHGGCWFRCGNQEIHIGVEEAFLPAKKAHPAFFIQRIDELKERLIEQEIQVIDDDARPDVIRFYIFDPFGNRIECMENRIKS
ncbi:glyoxalase [Bacillus cereus group sp. BfR-BA-01492]|uniref:glyoxalase n=1 Tax=Bacillus cereus group sp. BfR-BA-01492 TaxID=2920361 RepID=UPI0037C07DEA